MASSRRITDGKGLQGKEDPGGYLQEIMQRTGGTFRLRDVCVSGSDDHVLAVQHFAANLDGEERSFDVSSVMRFRDGRQAERWFHIHDQPGFDEFFARF